METTKSDYLGISGVQVFGWKSGGGDNEISSGSPANTMVKLLNPVQASPFMNNAHPAINAFSKNGSKWTLTNRGVGMWWRASFSENEVIDRVRILNRGSCCGERLAGTIVLIGNQECGKV